MMLSLAGRGVRRGEGYPTSAIIDTEIRRGLPARAEAALKCPCHKRERDSTHEQKQVQGSTTTSLKQSKFHALECNSRGPQHLQIQQS